MFHRNRWHKNYYIRKYIEIAVVRTIGLLTPIPLGSDHLSKICINHSHDNPTWAGSTETEWSIPEAGSIWADCLLRHLGVPSTDKDRDIDKDRDRDRDIKASNTEFTQGSHDLDDMLTQETGGVVMVTIGGGHYVPKVNDVVGNICS